MDYKTYSGVQENKFPSYMMVKSKNLHEEKRAFYVAITRAKKRLYINGAEVPTPLLLKNVIGN